MITNKDDIYDFLAAALSPEAADRKLTVYGEDKGYTLQGTLEYEHDKQLFSVFDGLDGVSFNVGEVKKIDPFWNSICLFSVKDKIG